MDNKRNDSLTEGLETFKTKLMLFGKYPNLTELYRLVPERECGPLGTFGTEPQT
jgi:hypothetical protein